ncbi:MAG: ABC-2 type transport system permease protein [Clostridium sp.]|jgi:ABC-2 type transport system permease protein
MLFNLVRKDFILVKKYLVVLIIIAIGVPIFTTASVNLSSAGFLGFFIATLYNENFLFATVSVAEEKYKGSALLCAIPYTRKTLVKAKYMSVLVIFISTYIIYTITAFVVPMGIDQLNIFTLGLALLIITIFWGFIIPAQYKFGYEKTKYISIVIIFISIAAVPNILEWLNAEDISLQIALPQVIQNLLPYFLTLLIGFISMSISIYIYSKKDL